MSQITHIALWTENLERLTAFYSKYFNALAGKKYSNPSKGFESCFLSFEGGARLEVMKSTMLSPVRVAPGVQRMGLTHLAFSVGSEQAVNTLTRRLKEDGYEIIDNPRFTGDDYYESVIGDPDGNRIEITI